MHLFFVNSKKKKKVFGRSEAYNDMKYYYKLSEYEKCYVKYSDISVRKLQKNCVITNKKSVKKNSN